MYGFPNKKNMKRQHFINDLIQKIVIAKNNDEDLVLFGTVLLFVNLCMLEILQK